MKKNMSLIPIANPCIEEEEARAAYEVVKSGWISMGLKVKEFEENICQYLGVENAIVINNGTSTLHSILLALSIKLGDEIIVPAQTHVATGHAIELTGAKPIFVDVQDDFNIDPYKIEKVITKNTKAIIPVHLTGRIANMDQINQIICITQKVYPLKFLFS